MHLFSTIVVLDYVLFHTCMCISISNSSEVSACPTWTYPSPPNNECVCGDTFDHSIFCDRNTLAVSIGFICMFNSEELQTTLVGTCPYGKSIKVPRNITQLMQENIQICFHLHRTGPFCEECKENYTLPVYSSYCVKCESYKNGWIKFIVAAFLQMTLFYIIVITFRLSVTSSTLNCFVMIHQVLAIAPVFR